MQATNLELQDLERPDVVALDKDGKIVLIVEVKGFPFDSNPKKTKENAILQILDYLKASKTLITFAMFVDLQNILVFQWNGYNLSEILSLNTGDILSYYEPAFNQKQIFNLYLTGLIEAWISDFCYHWKSKIPPASKEIAEIGLSQLLKGGITQP
ncbi:hypothetical protein FD723_28595 [Nostoc sp. C052]|uniref:hypothetical protein n=1 Tax=Nostoc sp. C052 TaxID=2576902 RepID=UPI0015C378A3|nr:hypothetical protein [Nostoc sp. C052]QLE44005.1 hypothetical protein FD723_28595 [Nostoc sp. C052]